MSESCENCRYSDQHPGEPSFWSCRRYPPNIIFGEESYSFFPTVKKGYWCGEWEADPSESKLTSIYQCPYCRRDDNYQSIISKQDSFGHLWLDHTCKCGSSFIAPQPRGTTPYEPI